MSTLARRALVCLVALAGCTVAGSAAPEPSEQEAPPAAAAEPAADSSESSS